MQRTPLGAMAWRLRGLALLSILAPTSSSPSSTTAAGAAVIVGLTHVVPFAERELAKRRGAEVGAEPRSVPGRSRPPTREGAATGKVVLRMSPTSP